MSIIIIQQLNVILFVYQISKFACRRDPKKYILPSVIYVFNSALVTHRPVWESIHTIQQVAQLFFNMSCFIPHMFHLDGMRLIQVSLYRTAGLECAIVQLVLSSTLATVGVVRNTWWGPVHWVSSSVSSSHPLSGPCLLVSDYAAGPLLVARVLLSHLCV